MSKVNEWLKQNTALKLLSVVLAFIIWITVVNFSNPEIKDTVTAEVSVINGEKLTSADKIYSLDSKSVKLSYRVRTKYRNRVTADRFQVYIDLNDYSITGAVPIYVNVDSEISGIISGVSTSPQVIHVATEDIQRKRFDVSLSTTGTPMEGYAVAVGSVSPDYVYVSGPVSEIGQISTIGIEVDVTEANEDLSGEAKPVFYDANGNPISVDSRISLSREEIAYSVPIQKIKSLSITAGVAGEPAEGYAFDGIDTSPSFIAVYGEDDVLARNLNLTIPDEAIDITGATRNVTRSIDVLNYLPQGLHLAQPGSEITVVAKIKKLPETLPSEEDEEEPETASEEAESSAQSATSTHTAVQHETQTSEHAESKKTEASVSEGHSGTESGAEE